MEQQLSGPDREAALQRVRDTARPADELAAVIRQRDFGRLRDMVRNRPASDLAAVLTDLSLEDQVLVFRILPRKAAAATFEYLSADDQHGLLKAMASEDVAALLNDMAPDDRTMFLEELPAEVTRHLLAQLTPEERAVAVGLLGYPEGSIGRLMTPQYVAVREDWTIAQVLDYIRAHGQDSETLNVIYVVDDRGVLIDDIIIRALLLASPSDADPQRDGSAFRRAEGDRRSGDGRRRLQRRGSHGAAGHRFRPASSSASSPSTTCWTSRKRRRPRTSSASAAARRSTSRTCRSASRA